MPDLCVLCGKELSNEAGVVKCTDKGIASLIKYSVQRGDNLKEKLRGLTVIRVHYKCQKDYTRRIKRDENIFVKSPCRGPPRSDRGVSVVTAESVRATVLDACKERSEEWVRKAAIRVHGTSSLVKENACYHRACFAALLDPSRPEPLLTSPVPLPSPPASTLSTPGEFKTPAKPSAKRPATSPAEGTPSRIPVPKLSAGRGRGKVRPGRPSDERKMAAFDRLCQRLESEDECQYTLAELVSMMPAVGADMDTPMYSEKHLERLLKERYPREIKIVERPGKSSILCFLSGKFDILGETWYMNRSKNEQEERHRIVLKAAEIVRSNILKIVHEPEYFPPVVGAGPNLVPESLTAFLERVTLPQKKRPGC
ncbi:Formate--tetrahydrofolate ligase [Frankliniella fusca]|uniref:Formate--tetrahydrofolate ligase n=1 Tax=Frankliniella fusca TaxID=407009 RepID=A0AAE1I2H1_9NEOP|nr:Formate--tetrahydrofolate ligase [Frankliniella fusca]